MGEIEETDSPLYDDNFEIDIFNKMTKDIIMKIIKTLPIQQQEIIIAYFGLDGQKNYNIIELADRYGISKERISEIKKEALNNLKYSIRTKYLFDVYDFDRVYPNIKILSNNRQSKAFEETLIKLLIKDCHLDLTKSLSEIQKELLELRLGLNNNESYNLEKISEILGIGYTHIYNYRKIILDRIKQVIIREYYHIEDISSISYEEYLDYLMKLYLSKSNNIKKNNNHKLIRK